MPSVQSDESQASPPSARVTRGRWRLSPLLAALTIGLSVQSLDARAASNDKEVEELLGSALDDSAGGKHDAALEKLDIAVAACEGTSCSAGVRAKMWVAIGVARVGKKQAAKAREAFKNALGEDPNVKVPAKASDDAKKAFDEVKAEAKPKEPDKPRVPDKPAEPGAAPKGGTRGPKVKFEGGGKAPRGWKSAEAAFYFDQAKSSEGKQEWADCYDYAVASSSAEARVSTHSLAAACAERAGLWVEALAELSQVIDKGPGAGLAALARSAQAKSAELKQKVPRLVIRPPAKSSELVVKIDDAPVPEGRVGGELWVNPGQRLVTAKGKADGVPYEFEQAVDVAEFETATVDIRPGAKTARDPAVTRCMLAAKTTEDIAKCINASSATRLLDFKLGTELSFYSDSDRVDVFSPAAFASVENKTDGWGLGASFVVDVVTAASSDIIATASPRWTETRYAPGLSGHKKTKDVDVGLRASASFEPDYIATSFSASVSADLANKMVTPSLAYEFSYDLQGRSGTPFSVYGRELTRHAIDGAVTFVLDKATIAGISGTAIFEEGDSSKPYRYIPMFSPEIAQNVRPGQSIDSVNAARLPLRVLEQLPTNRQRFALAGRIAHRFSASTLRVEERLYIDSWGLKASTTDAKLLIDVGKQGRIWPHLRFHVQDDVDFWRLAYPVYDNAVAGCAPLGSTAPCLPALRTGDRELGNLLGLTVGLGGRFAFGAKKNFAVALTTDVVYTRFFETLFILQRFGFLGALTLEAAF